MKDTLTTRHHRGPADGRRRHRRSTSTLGVMSDEQRAALREQLRGGAAEREIPFAKPGSLTRVYAVASGKGGVGKSSVTVNLAAAMAPSGLRVGVVDADVYGFSVPRMLGVEQRPDPGRRHDPAADRARREGHLDRHVRPRQPAGRLARADAAPRAAAVPRRRLLGRPRRAAARPAARHRRHRDLGRPAHPDAEILVVTTPQQAAAEVAERAGSIALQTHQRIVGVIENMSWLELPDGTRQEIFGSRRRPGRRRLAHPRSRRRRCRCSARSRWTPGCARAATRACRSCCGDAGLARPRWRCGPSPAASRPARGAWPAARWASPPPVAERPHRGGAGDGVPGPSRVPGRGHRSRGQVASVSHGVGRDGSYARWWPTAPLTSPWLARLSSSSSASRTIRRGSY